MVSGRAFGVKLCYVFEMKAFNVAFAIDVKGTNEWIVPLAGILGNNVWQCLFWTLITLHKA